jgi:hypothetical protein
MEPLAQCSIPEVTPKEQTMIRIAAKFFSDTVALIVCLPIQPSSAFNIAYVSASGSGIACTQVAPCALIEAALETFPVTGGRVVCLTGAGEFVVTILLVTGLSFLIVHQRPGLARVFSVMRVECTSSNTSVSLDSALCLV